MSWFARSIANTLLSTDDRDTDGEDPRPSASPSPGSPPRGVREDLSEFTDVLAHRFQGLASFLAAPSPGGSGGAPRAPNPAEIAGRFRAGLARLPSSDLSEQSRAVIQKADNDEVDDDGDEWLKEDMGCSGSTHIQIAEDDEDVSFSDLEEDDDAA